MKQFIILLTILCLGVNTVDATKSKKKNIPAKSFITIDGVDLRDGQGNKFFIRGTNLGHWLNPEGYMFGFESQKVGSPWKINQVFCELVGPEFTAQFWRQFKENFITKYKIHSLHWIKYHPSTASLQTIHG